MNTKVLRAMLYTDVMVKSSLVKTQQSFSEWLFGIRLLKDHMQCPRHPFTSAIKVRPATRAKCSLIF